MTLQVFVNGVWRTIVLTARSDAERYRYYWIRPAKGFEDEFSKYYGDDYGPSRKGSRK